MTAILGRMEIDLDGTDLARVAELVHDVRTTKGWSKEQAAREAGISSITWKRIEDGLRVQDAKLALAFKALGLRGVGIERADLLTDDDYSGMRLRTPGTPNVFSPEGRTDLERRIALLMKRAAELREQLSEVEAQLNSLVRVLVQVTEAEAEPVGPNLAAVAKEGEIEPPGEFD